MNLQVATQIEGSSAMPGFDSHMLYVLIIMLLAGILGGYANFFLRDGTGTTERTDWIKYPVLGVVVALTAPLFLNMISSNLVDAARTRASDYLVLGGFCLVYVVASRRLVENAANRVLFQVEAVKRELARMRHFAPIAASPLQRPAEAGPDAPTRNEPPRETLTHADVELLRVIGEENFVYGNLAALSERTGVPRELVGQRLAILKSWGVIETRISDKNMYWTVAPKGRQMLLDLIGGGDDKRAG
jgi:hypothetical protein